MTENQEKGLKAISELLGYKFVVPAYQRGYRWGDGEVRALLEDVWDYAKEPKAKFYCLQPVVVCEVSGGDSASEKKTYNLIDGQQRLTTIYLILKYLGKKPFELEYQTGTQSAAILEKGGDAFPAARSKMDIAHFENARRVIKEFFEDGKEGQVGCLGEENQRKFKDTLLKSCKVLWYEPLQGQKNDGGQTEEEIFVKFNAYKIRLTDEENIKALFLSKGAKLESGEDNRAKKQEIQDRAKIWYDTELNLREEDDFRYLTLRKIDKKDIIEIDGKRMVSDNIMRIGAYLEAISGKSGGEMFEKFHELYKNRKKPQEGEEPNFEDKWGELEECVKVFEKLLSLPCSNNFDRELCHYLGFLTQCGKGLKKLKDVCGGENPKQKLLTLAQECLKVSGNGEDKNNKKMEDLDYNNASDKERIAQILLFLNWYWLEGEEYFEFNKYQLEQWSLEHIHPRSPKDDDWAQEMERVKIYLKNNGSKVDDKEEEYFKSIYDGFQSDGIENLALLDRASNSGLNNGTFVQKREKIQSYSEKKFVPIGTKRVFEKDFEGTMKNIEIFTPQDQKAYLEVIQKTIGEFLAPKK